MLQEKRPLIKCDPKELKFKENEITFYSKIFTTPNGSKGFWEYCNHEEETVFLSVILMNREAFIIRKEVQVCTHERQAFGSFYFGKVGIKEDIESKAVEICEGMGLKGLKVILSSKQEDGCYTDPWKSNQKCKTMVILCESDSIDLPAGYISLPITGAVQELTRLAKE